LAHRGLTLNVANSTIHYQGTSTELSRNEFIIMQLFMRSIGRIVSREELMQALWREEQFVDDNTLTVNVNRLRRRLAQLGMEDLINTRKGMGYIAE
jgi:DNA-binding response OmpR family regulator